MFKMFYLAILLAIISCSLAIDKEIKSCRCLAHLDVTDGLTEANRLNTLDITEQIPKDIICDNRGEFYCKSLCKEIFKNETNNFDLDKTPITSDTTIKESLGQYLCDIIHKDVSNVLLGITSELSCVNTKSGNNEITTSTLKIYIDDKKITCLNGKYVKQ